MELFLNLTWLAISVVLAMLMVASRIRGESGPCRLVHSRKTAWISYLVLVALLLPAISMTDDLMAMVAPTDSEQVVRRYEVCATGHAAVTAVVAYYLPGRQDFSPRFVSSTDLLSIHRFVNPETPQQNCVKGRAPPAIV